MTGLVPVIHVVKPARGTGSGTAPDRVTSGRQMSGGCVHIMTNRPNGIRYTGVIQQQHETQSARAGIVGVTTDALLNPSSEDLGRPIDGRSTI